ncbi:hypothetical protein [Actinomycetospora aeridis]|uniref:Tetratricopeptide repeat protein n=1 Tax=Actinomycetospora aeridis TaxID=3129231 RepID=A0ABU8N664_9PSEU
MSPEDAETLVLALRAAQRGLRRGDEALTADVVAARAEARSLLAALPGPEAVTARARIEAAFGNAAVARQGYTAVAAGSDPAGAQEAAMYLALHATDHGDLDAARHWCDRALTGPSPETREQAERERAALDRDEARRDAEQARAAEARRWAVVRPAVERAVAAAEAAIGVGNADGAWQQLALIMSCDPPAAMDEQIAALRRRIERLGGDDDLHEIGVPARSPRRPDVFLAMVDPLRDVQARAEEQARAARLEEEQRRVAQAAASVPVLVVQDAPDIAPEPA